MSAADGYAPQMLSPAVENLVAQLTRSCLGCRTAQRSAFHILQTPKQKVLALAEAIVDVKERVRFCGECGNLTEEEVCAICRDARRDHSIICVVEQPVDLISLERTAEFLVSTTCSAERCRPWTESSPRACASTETSCTVSSGTV